MDVEAIKAALSGDVTAAGCVVGTSIPDELLEDLGALEYGQIRLNEDSNYAPWSVRAIILTAERRMIGHIRFHTRPDPEYLQLYARNAVERTRLCPGSSKGRHGLGTKRLRHPSFRCIDIA
jgi:hypothetical protein